MDITNFLIKVDDLILNPLILLVSALAIVYFFYGIVRFLQLDAADKSRDEAKGAIVWGLVGILIMLSVYGIIHFVLDTFGVNTAADTSITTAKPFLKL